MKFVYFPLLAVLFWSYWRALTRARDERTPLTPLMGWLIGLGYFAIAPLTVLILRGGYRIPDIYEANDEYASVDLSDSRYIIPMLVTSLALFLAFQAVAFFRPRKKEDWRALELPLNDQKLRGVILLSFGLSVLDFIFTIWLSGGLELFLISHWQRRHFEFVAKFGDLYVLYSQLSLANQIVFTAASSLFTARQLQSRKSDWRFFTLIALGLVLEMVVSGNRIFIALYGLSFLTACWIYSRKRLIVTILLLSPAALLFFSLWAFVRHNVSSIPEELSGHLENGMENRVAATVMDATEGANIMILMHIINDFGNKYEFFYGLTYSKAVIFLVPRALYPNKPENYTGQIARLYEPGEDTSLNTTQLGELYANFGIFTVLLLPFFTILINFLSANLTRKIEGHVLLLTALFLLMIWFARSSFEDNFITFVFTAALISGLRLERGLYCGGQLE